MAELPKETVFVDGMTCSSCAGSVTKTMSKLGLKNVNTNYITGEVVFNNETNVSFETIKKSIDGIGYKATGQKKIYTGKLSSVEKKFLFTLPFSTILMLHMFLSHDSIFNHPYFQLSLCIPVFIIGVLHFGKSAYGSLKAGFPNMDVLIITGILSSFGYSLYGTLAFNIHEAHTFLFYETAAVITTLVLLGNVIEHRSVKKTTTAIEDLVKLQKVKAKLVVGENIVEVDAESLVKMDVFQINEGDRIPADGRIISGTGWADESMITGESKPLEKNIGDEIIGGTIWNKGNARVKVLRSGSETVLSHIIRTVNEAGLSKPPIQNLADKISVIFVPAVLLISVSTFLLSYFVFDVSLTYSILHSVAVLVISCPCAMGLATPTAVAVGLGRAAKSGIMIKGGSTFESLSKVKTIIFDKTGTLTTGNFIIQEYYFTDEKTKNENLNIIRLLENKSSHPIATSISLVLKDFSENIYLENIEEIKGKGMQATLANEIIQLGSTSWLGNYFPDEIKENFSIFLVKNDIPIAALKIRDELKSDAKIIIDDLKKSGIRPVILSGDKQKIVEEIANTLGIETFYFEKNPIEKLAIVRAFSKQHEVAMLGDGINDAPSLTAAGVGISFSAASQVAINSAQVVLLNNDKLSSLTDAIQISKMTIQTIKQNLFWAFFYNVIAIPVAAFGFLNPMFGALSMALSDLMVIGNSIRLKFRKI